MQVQPLLGLVVVSNMPLLPSNLFLAHLEVPLSFLDHSLSRLYKIMSHFSFTNLPRPHPSNYLLFPTPTIKNTKRISPTTSRRQQCSCIMVPSCIWAFSINLSVSLALLFCCSQWLPQTLTNCLGSQLHVSKISC